MQSLTENYDTEKKQYTAKLLKLSDEILSLEKDKKILRAALCKIVIITEGLGCEKCTVDALVIALSALKET